jgi:hypothetical protein
MERLGRELLLLLLLLLPFVLGLFLPEWSDDRILVMFIRAS